MVTNVIVVSDDDTSEVSGVESEAIGIASVKTSHTTKKTYNGSIRGNYAGIDIPIWKMLLPGCWFY